MNSALYQDWCRRLRHSDRGAFEELFRALHDTLIRYSAFITFDEAAARDVVQETFIRLWEMRESLDEDRSVKSLLFRMVRNGSYNHQRNRRRREQILFEESHGRMNGEVVAPDGILSAHNLDAKLRVWMDRLPERQREALMLSRYEGLSHQEIADAMGISPRTVNNHLVRALETLRDHIREYEPELLAS